jgi:hypothetical protein
MDELFEKLVEATASQLRRKQQSVKRLFPDFDAKTKGVEDKGGLRLVDQNVNRWTFKIHSGTQDSLWYDAYLDFKLVKPTLERMVKDRRLWVSDGSRVDLRKLAKQFMDKVDIQLYCSCPADLYYGGQYIRSKDKYDANAGNRKETRPPKKKNPKQYGAVCKHLDRLLKVLPFYSGTAARWIKDFYADDIAKWEEEATAKYDWAKKITKALVKKREEIPVEKPPVKPKVEPEIEPKVEPEVEPPKEEPKKEPKGPKVSTEEPGISKDTSKEPGISKKKFREPGISKAEPAEPGISKEEPVEKPEEEEPEEEKPKKGRKTAGGKKADKEPEGEVGTGTGPEEEYF